MSSVVRVERNITLDGRFLNLPIAHGNEWKTAALLIDGMQVLSFNVEVTGDEPEMWTHADVGRWTGEGAVIVLSCEADFDPACINAITISDRPEGNPDLLNEGNRMVFHYGPALGWTNDPNGLVYHDGVWHHFYQYNPYSMRWNNMCWGHAISKDLATWTELPVALHCNDFGDGGIFSGSAVIDHRNVSGLGIRGAPPMLLFYTDSGRKAQCLAYSNDNGFTFERYESNPIIPNIRGMNRDPKVLWYEPTGVWVMILYIEENEFALFNSQDLIHWAEVSRFKQSLMCECPDLFSLTADDGTCRWTTGLETTLPRPMRMHWMGEGFSPDGSPVRSEAVGILVYRRTVSSACHGSCR